MTRRTQGIVFALGALVLAIAAPVIGSRSCGGVEGSMWLVPILVALLAGGAVSAAMRGKHAWARALVICGAVILVFAVDEIFVLGATIDTHYCP